MTLNTYRYILERSEAANLQILVQGAEQEFDHRDERLFNDEVLGHRQRPEVVVESVAEECVDDVEVVLVTLVLLRDGGRLSGSRCGLDHFSLASLLGSQINN